MNGVIEFRQDENGENFPSENTMDRLEYRLSSIEDMEKEEIQKYINHGDLVRFKEGNELNSNWEYFGSYDKFLGVILCLTPWYKLYGLLIYSYFLFWLYSTYKFTYTPKSKVSTQPLAKLS